MKINKPKKYRTFQRYSRNLSGTCYKSRKHIKLSCRQAYLKYDRLVVFLKVKGKDVSEHESLSALTQYVHSFLEELNFNP